MMKFSKNAQDLVPFLAMEIMERGMALKESGRSIVQLGVGEPNFDPPPQVLEATHGALDAHMTHYTDSRGLTELREAIAEDCWQRRGKRVSPNQIIVTSGTSPALSMVMHLLLEPGDELIIPTPHYACYPNMVRLCGAIPVLVETAPEDGYKLDVQRVRDAISPRTRGILLASPANPTGAVQPPEVMKALAELDIPLLSDEIYDGLVFDGVTATSPLQYKDDVFIFDGFSKRYAMTGFRLGYVIAPEKAIRPLQTMQQNLHISAAHFPQAGAIAALKFGQKHLEMMRQTYEKRRKILLGGLRAMGMKIPVDPVGAFYILADPGLGSISSLDLAFRILDEAGVAVGPGKDFGEIAEGKLRFSYAASENDINEAIHRLEKWFQSNR
ncbi:MAG: pyridoxal phosphate-dependent aminotransferase [Deltaproteobacteria bacterium]|nr:pyridoxal phosphate-dependent aminotransferase [Deltaproteobacteria bacterium]